ncbi:hypothetical protein [Desulfosediminicola flagellatus]|uniref:hypothetical protein n=1 Tax=Desulfosediminicola flagellatus TaxID=2569541 RepID=UPI0010AC8C81|nr:hypothetical protein [Desulfosediminicola flagellatus]
MKQLQRTLFFITFPVWVFSFTIILNVFSSYLSAEEKPEMIISYLIHTLRSINKPVCEKAADNLQSLTDNKSNYDLHLRNADLTYKEIQRIAEAIKTVHDKRGPSLKSFSMSYNKHLGDEGVFVLVKALPPTVTEIGLVQCGIGDQGGDSLISWAINAPKLKWLCVEQNSFSDEIKRRFIQLGKERNGLLVVL